MTKINLRAESQLREQHERIPSAHCQGLCTSSCGPIMMSAYEAGRFAAAAARAHIDVELYSLGGDGGFGVSVPLDTLRCPALGDDGRCRVYDARPIVCRLYGSVDELRCEHGCRPERLLSTSEARDVLRAAGEIEQ